MKNLALIGMMGCGKTTLAKALSQMSGRTLFSCDAEIERDAGMSIDEIFLEEGEMGFRIREGKCVFRAATQKNLIIDCGGGIVTRKEHVMILKNSSLMVYIRRPIDSIIDTFDFDGRPLSKDPENLQKIFAERAALYEQYADHIVDNLDFDTCINELQVFLKELS